MKTILVTGGLGYIGSHTCKELVSRGYKVIVVDKDRQKSHRYHDRLYRIDITDLNSLHNVFNEERINGVIHFAAASIVPESMIDPAKYYQNNVVGTFSLLEAMRVAGVNNLVFSSTAAVYGSPMTVPIDTGENTFPMSPYGTTKLMAEGMIEDYRTYNINSFILRYFNVAGADPAGMLGEEREHETHLIPLLLNAIKNDLPFTVYGADYNTTDGTCIRDYVHVTDVARVHISALEHLMAGETGRILNIGTGHGYSVRSIIAAAQEVTQKKVKIIYGKRRDGDPDWLLADVKLANTLLDWKAEFTVTDMIQHAWNRLNR